MENLNRQLNMKKFALIVAIILGCFLLYREATFWNSYQALGKNFSQDMTNFQKAFFDRMDSMHKKDEEMKAYFDKREAAFNQKFGSAWHASNDKAVQGDTTEEGKSETEQIIALQEKLEELTYRVERIEKLIQAIAKKNREAS